MEEDPAPVPIPNPAYPVVPHLPQPLPGPVADLSATTGPDSATATLVPLPPSERVRGTRRAKAPPRKPNLLWVGPPPPIPAMGPSFPCHSFHQLWEPQSICPSGRGPSTHHHAIHPNCYLRYHPWRPGSLPLTDQKTWRPLVPASLHVETYVRVLAGVVGLTAIMAASKMYGKVVFFLASEAATQEAVEKGLVVGGVFVPLELLEDLGVLVVLTSVPPFLPNTALLPALSTLGKPISVISSLLLGCKDPTLCHVLSFRRQVQSQLPQAARDGVALEGSFLVPYQGAHYHVHYTMGEAQCFLYQVTGHDQRNCSRAQHGGESGTAETRESAGLVIVSDPGGLTTTAAAPPPAVVHARAAETASRHAQTKGWASPPLVAVRGVWRREQRDL